MPRRGIKAQAQPAGAGVLRQGAGQRMARHALALPMHQHQTHQGIVKQRKGPGPACAAVKIQQHSRLIQGQMQLHHEHARLNQTIGQIGNRGAVRQQQPVVSHAPPPAQSAMPRGSARNLGCSCLPCPPLAGFSPASILGSKTSQPAPPCHPKLNPPPTCRA